RRGLHSVSRTRHREALADLAPRTSAWRLRHHGRRRRRRHRGRIAHLRRHRHGLALMFDRALLDLAADVLSKARAKKLRIATAESCTGGLIAGCLTEIPGSSDVFDRGFVTYSNAAKTTELGVTKNIIDAHGAVSKETALAMVEGALKNSNADCAVACTGIAGPGGGSKDKPVGL